MCKKIIYLAMLVSVLAFGLILVSCGGGSGSMLAGIWELDRVENGPSRDVVGSFEFFKDGSGNMLGMSITWKAEGNRLMITTGGQAQAFDFKLSGTTLTIIYDNQSDYKSIYHKRGTSIQTLLT